jgi:para-nitrobenzyl esterase
MGGGDFTRRAVTKGVGLAALAGPTLLRGAPATLPAKGAREGAVWSFPGIRYARAARFERPVIAATIEQPYFGKAAFAPIAPNAGWRMRRRMRIAFTSTSGRHRPIPPPSAR